MQLSTEEILSLVSNSYIDRRGRNVYGVCVKCGHDEFGISLEDNHRFGCFRKKECGFRGNIFTLLAYLGKSVYDVKPGFKPRAELEGKLFIDNEVKIDLELQDCAPPLGWKPVKEHSYLVSRGFTETDYKKYNPGTTLLDSRFKDFIVFSIIQSNAPVAYIGRNTKSKEEIEQLNLYYKLSGSKKKVKRYLNSYSDFAKILLGIEECNENTSTVILVEGLFDKQNVDKVLGLDLQSEVKCCCTWKCGISDEQVFLLQQSGISTVILLYDPDVIEEIKKAAWQIENYFKTYVGFNVKGTDPGDMTEDDFDDTFANLQSPSQFSIYNFAVKKLIKK